VRTFLGASLLLAGNFLLLSLVSPLWTPGFVYVLAATILWAAEYTLSKRLLTKLPAATVALGRMGFGGLFLAGYLALTAQWAQVGGFSGAQWEWVGLSAVLLTAFVLAWYHGLRRVDLGPATSVLVLGFPITWTLSVLVSGSAFTVAQVAGAALVAGGAIVFVLAPVARSASRLRSSAASPE
ncbi:MAG: DMT family transporter, partial [Thermoplasmata archaeon]|nr:DMT family transporter [Thermoplasmata archaeon]